MLVLEGLVLQFGFLLQLRLKAGNHNGVLLDGLLEGTLLLLQNIDYGGKLIHLLGGC